MSTLAPPTIRLFGEQRATAGRAIRSTANIMLTASSEEVSMPLLSSPYIHSSSFLIILDLSDMPLKIGNTSTAALQVPSAVMCNVAQFSLSAFSHGMKHCEASRRQNLSSPLDLASLKKKPILLCFHTVFNHTERWAVTRYMYRRYVKDVRFVTSNGNALYL